jgi:hypothetical protein
VNVSIRHFTFVLPMAAAFTRDFMAKTTIYQNCRGINRHEMTCRPSLHSL